MQKSGPEQTENDLVELAKVSKDLSRIDRQRKQLVRQRDRLVFDLAASGIAFNALARTCGLTRQALTKRIDRQRLVDALGLQDNEEV